ncbi:MAG: asparagine synthetase B, partial [Elusimicrobia bacterium]|nr:asparagine synthetase B [Elusimicrobiota bacterium]
AGYDYYGAAAAAPPLVQGTKESPVRPECLEPGFAEKAWDWDAPAPFPDRLRNLQYRDLRHTKIPRALRFNDRVSMRSGTELREPFLDHRLVELALRQPPERKIRGGVHKWFLRRLAEEVLPADLSRAPKRPVQTPQREWLAGPLKEWAGECIEAALRAYGGQWLREEAVRSAWRAYGRTRADNSFYVWQWISLGLMAGNVRAAGRHV